MSIGPFYVGDAPATPVIIDLLSEDDISSYRSAAVTLRDPQGGVIFTVPDAAVEEDYLAFTFPNECFKTGGVYSLIVQLLGAGTMTLAPQPIIIQDINGWHTLDSARADWEQAPDNDLTLWTVLETSRIDCEAYAPLLNGRPVPVNYRAAQLLQTRNTLNAGRVNPAGEYGQESFALSPFPLDWKVKALLRPKRGVPVVS